MGRGTDAAGRRSGQIDLTLGMCGGVWTSSLNLKPAESRQDGMESARIYLRTGPPWAGGDLD